MFLFQIQVQPGMDVLKPCSATGQNADNGMRGSEKSSHIHINISMYHRSTEIPLKILHDVQKTLRQCAVPTTGIATLKLRP